MVTTVDNIVLVFTARGVQRVSNQITTLGVASGGAAKQTGLLAGGIAALGSVLAVQTVVQYADAVTELENRLRLVSDTSEEVTFRTQAIFDIAEKTRGSVEETGRTFFRFARANERLGLSEAELLQITETVNQAVAISGTTAQSAASALFQFSQGIAAGTLRGQELNSVLEQVPGLAELLAEGLGVGVDQLRSLGAAGELTGKQIADALLKVGGSAAEQFGRITFTVSQEFERLRTEIIRFIGELDDAVDFTGKLTGAIKFLADNLDVLAKILAVVALQFAKAFGARTVRAINAVTVAIARNPFGALAVAISTAVTALTIFRDDIILFEESGATLGTTLEVAFDKLGPAIGEAFDTATMAASQFFEELTGTTVEDAFSQLLSTTEDGLNGSVGAFREFANIAIGLLSLPLRVFINNLQLLPPAVGDALLTAAETFRQVVTGQFDFTGLFTAIKDFIIESFDVAFNFVAEKARLTFESIKNFDFTIPDIEIPDIDFEFLQDPIENRFDGAIEAFQAGFSQVITDTFGRDFVGEAAGAVNDFKINVVDPFIREVAAAQAAKDAATAAAEQTRAARTDRPDTEFRPDPKTVEELQKIVDKFEPLNQGLRDSLELLRANRDLVAQYSEQFGISVEEIDFAISAIEDKIAGTVNFQEALWVGLAENAKNALVDVLLNPFEASLKDLTRAFAQAMQKIVVEALAAELILASLNFLQGFVGFQIPGATRAPRLPGSVLGGPIIGGEPRLVGERGPEVIIPQSRSTVISNGDLRSGFTNDDTAITQRQIAKLAQSVANLNLRVVNVNEQDPAALLSTLTTQEGTKVQRNFVTTDQRQVRRALGIR